MPPDSPPRITRRQFVWFAVVGAAGAAAARVTLRPRPVHLAPPGLRVLDETDWAVLRAVCEAFLPPGVRDDTGVLTEVVARADRYLAQLPPALQRRRSTLLRAVEHGPVVFTREAIRCSAMSIDQRTAYLATWAESRLAVRRTGFAALKHLAMLGYYTRESAWPAIGYSGPLV